MKTVLTLMGEN